MSSSPTILAQRFLGTGGEGQGHRSKGRGRQVIELDSSRAPDTPRERRGEREHYGGVRYHHRATNNSDGVDGSGNQHRGSRKRADESRRSRRRRSRGAGGYESRSAMVTPHRTRGVSAEDAENDHVGVMGYPQGTAEYLQQLATGGGAPPFLPPAPTGPGGRPLFPPGYLLPPPPMFPFMVPNLMGSPGGGSPGVPDMLGGGWPDAGGDNNALINSMAEALAAQATGQYFFGDQPPLFVPPPPLLGGGGSENDVRPAPPLLTDNFSSSVLGDHDFSSTQQSPALKSVQPPRQHAAADRFSAASPRGQNYSPFDQTLSRGPAGTLATADHSFNNQQLFQTPQHRPTTTSPFTHPGNSAQHPQRPPPLQTTHLPSSSPQPTGQAAPSPLPPSAAQSRVPVATDNSPFAKFVPLSSQQPPTPPAVSPEFASLYLTTATDVANGHRPHTAAFGHRHQHHPHPFLSEPEPRRLWHPQPPPASLAPPPSPPAFQGYSSARPPPPAPIHAPPQLGYNSNPKDDHGGGPGFHNNFNGSNSAATDVAQQRCPPSIVSSEQQPRPFITAPLPAIASRQILPPPVAPAPQLPQRPGSAPPLPPSSAGRLFASAFSHWRMPSNNVLSPSVQPFATGDFGTPAAPNTFASPSLPQALQQSARHHPEQGKAKVINRHQTNRQPTSFASSSGGAQQPQVDRQLPPPFPADQLANAATHHEQHSSSLHQNHHHPQQLPPRHQQQHKSSQHPPELPPAGLPRTAESGAYPSLGPRILAGPSSAAETPAKLLSPRTPPPVAAAPPASAQPSGRSPEDRLVPDTPPAMPSAVPPVKDISPRMVGATGDFGIRSSAAGTPARRTEKSKRSLKARKPRASTAGPPAMEAEAVAKPAASAGSGVWTPPSPPAAQGLPVTTWNATETRGGEEERSVERPIVFDAQAELQSRSRTASPTRQFSNRNDEHYPPSTAVIAAAVAKANAPPTQSARSASSTNAGALRQLRGEETAAALWVPRTQETSPRGEDKAEKRVTTTPPGKPEQDARRRHQASGSTPAVGAGEASSRLSANRPRRGHRSGDATRNQHATPVVLSEPHDTAFVSRPSKEFRPSARGTARGNKTPSEPPQKLAGGRGGSLPPTEYSGQGASTKSSPDIAQPPSTHVSTPRTKSTRREVSHSSRTDTRENSQEIYTVPRSQLWAPPVGSWKEAASPQPPSSKTPSKPIRLFIGHDPGGGGAPPPSTPPPPAGNFEEMSSEHDRQVQHHNSSSVRRRGDGNSHRQRRHDDHRDDFSVVSRQQHRHHNQHHAAAAVEESQWNTRGVRRLGSNSADTPQQQSSQSRRDGTQSKGTSWVASTERQEATSSQRRGNLDRRRAAETSAEAAERAAAAAVSTDDIDDPHMPITRVVAQMPFLRDHVKLTPYMSTPHEIGARSPQRLSDGGGGEDREGAASGGSERNASPGGNRRQYYRSAGTVNGEDRNKERKVSDKARRAKRKVPAAGGGGRGRRMDGGSARIGRREVMPGSPELGSKRQRIRIGGASVGSDEREENDSAPPPPRYDKALSGEVVGNTIVWREEKLEEMERKHKAGREAAKRIAASQRHRAHYREAPQQRRGDGYGYSSNSGRREGYSRVDGGEPRAVESVNSSSGNGRRKYAEGSWSVQSHVEKASRVEYRSSRNSNMAAKNTIESSHHSQTHVSDRSRHHLHDHINNTDMKEQLPRDEQRQKGWQKVGRLNEGPGGAPDEVEAPPSSGSALEGRHGVPYDVAGSGDGDADRVDHRPADEHENDEDDPSRWELTAHDERLPVDGTRQPEEAPSASQHSLLSIWEKAEMKERLQAEQQRKHGSAAPTAPSPRGAAAGVGEEPSPGAEKFRPSPLVGGGEEQKEEAGRGKTAEGGSQSEGAVTGQLQEAVHRDEEGENDVEGIELEGRATPEMTMTTDSASRGEGTRGSIDADGSLDSEGRSTDRGTSQSKERHRRHQLLLRHRAVRAQLGGKSGSLLTPPALRARSANHIELSSASLREEDVDSETSSELVTAQHLAELASGKSIQDSTLLAEIQYLLQQGTGLGSTPQDTQELLALWRSANLPAVLAEKLQGSWDDAERAWDISSAIAEEEDEDAVTEDQREGQDSKATRTARRPHADSTGAASAASAASDWSKPRSKLLSASAQSDSGGGASHALGSGDFLPPGPQVVAAMRHQDDVASQLGMRRKVQFVPLDLPVEFCNTHSVFVECMPSLEGEAQTDALTKSENGMSLRKVEVIRLCISPTVYVFPQLLTSAECDALTAAAEGRWKDAGSGRQPSSQTPAPSPSFAMLDKIDEAPVVDLVERRIAQLTKASLDRIEPLRVMRYGVGQCSGPHHDGAFRSHSAYVFLNDVEEGGEFHFVHLGIKIPPNKGLAVLWPCILAVPHGGKAHADLRSVHGSLPPTKSTKYSLAAFVSLESVQA